MRDLLENLLELTGMVFGGLLAGLFILSMFALGALLIHNLDGILFGYSPYSKRCTEPMTRFEYVIRPITPYACKKDAGLLQPYARDFVWYMSQEVEK